MHIGLDVLEGHHVEAALAPVSSIQKLTECGDAC
jgi:hypothetical protein